MDKRLEFLRQVLDWRTAVELRSHFEQRLKTTFRLDGSPTDWQFVGKMKVTGATWRIEVKPLGQGSAKSLYEITASVSWIEFADTYDDYFSKTSPKWFSFWVEDLPLAPVAFNAVMDLARQRDEFTQLRREDKENIETLRQRIVTGLESGGELRMSHKEGGTRFYCQESRFYRQDYGDHEQTKRYAKSDELLSEALSYFSAWFATPGDGQDHTPEERWRLLLRQVQAI
jgi:hypothetical protein